MSSPLHILNKTLTKKQINKFSNWCLISSSYEYEIIMVTYISIKIQALFGCDKMRHYNVYTKTPSSSGRHFLIYL